MKKTNKLKIISFLLATVLLLTACSQKVTENNLGKKELQQQENYQEEVFLLSNEIAVIGEIVQQQDSTIRLIGRTQEEEVFVWDSKDNGTTWEEVQNLTELLREEGIDSQDISIKMNRDGRIVLQVFNGTEEKWYLLNKNFEVEEITEKVEKFIEENMIQTLEWISEDTLFGLTVFQEGVFIDLEQGKSESIEVDGAIRAHTIKDNVLYLLTDSGIQGIDISSHQKTDIPEAGKIIAEYVSQLSFSIRTDVELCITDDESSIYVIDGEAGYIFTSQGGKKIFERGKNSLGDENVILQGIIPLEEGKFLAAVQTDNGKILYCYTEQKQQQTTATQDSQGSLIIYSLKDNVNIRQMVYLYQKAYPDMDITYEAGIEDDEISEEEAIKVLNTRLASGEGPDIIVLEGLEYEKYIQQGILEEVSEFAKAECDSQDLFRGILSAYTYEGGQYGIPTYLSLMMMSGNVDVTEQTDTLETLAGFFEKTAQGASAPVFENWSFDQIVSITYRNYLLNKENTLGDIGQEELEAYYSLISELYQMTDMEEVETGGKTLGNISVQPIGYNNMDLVLTGEVCIALDYLAVPDDVRKAEILKENNYSNILLQNDDEIYYVPMISFGIVKGENSESARQFISYMLSEEVQESFDYAGLPVNRQVMLQKLKGFETGTVEILTEEGGENTFVYNGVDENALNEWMKIFDNMSYASIAEQNVFNIIMENAEEVVSGEMSAEKAAETAYRKLSLYLAE